MVFTFTIEKYAKSTFEYPSDLANGQVEKKIQQ